MTGLRVHGKTMGMGMKNAHITYASVDQVQEKVMYSTSALTLRIEGNWP